MHRHINFTSMMSFMVIESFSCATCKMVQTSKNPGMGFDIVFPKSKVMLPSVFGHERNDAVASQQRLFTSQNSVGSIIGHMKIHSKTLAVVPRSHQSLII